VSIGDLKPRVLVVDDSLTVRMDLRDALEEAGCDVTLSESLQTARAAIARGPFDAAVLDVLLPDGDGIELLTELRHGAHAELPVIAQISEKQSELAKQPHEVLAVDDSETFLELIWVELGREGYDAQRATNGQQARGRLAVERMECILLDLRISGLSGEETGCRIKASPAWRDLPLIMLTATDEREAMIGWQVRSRRKDTPGLDAIPVVIGLGKPDGRGPARGAHFARRPRSEESAHRDPLQRRVARGQLFGRRGSRERAADRGSGAGDEPDGDEPARHQPQRGRNAGAAEQPGRSLGADRQDGQRAIAARGAAEARGERAEDRHRRRRGSAAPAIFGVPTIAGEARR